MRVIVACDLRFSRIGGIRQIMATGDAARSGVGNCPPGSMCARDDPVNGGWIKGHRSRSAAQSQGHHGVFHDLVVGL